MARFNVAEYRAYIRFSHNKRLLVEGRNDRRVFITLIDAALKRIHEKHEQIEIDTAEDLAGEGFEGTRGNREKVEYICQMVVGTPDARKIVGFVDREFRGFEVVNGIADKINGHNVVGRLIWSRGHSIQNYSFDPATLQEPLETLTPSVEFKEALRTFLSVFRSVILTACATTLAALECGRLNLAKGSISWKLIEIHETAIALRLDDWRAIFIDRQHTDPSQADALIRRYQFWLERVRSADFQVIRWLCHGHIGFAFIWATYTRCVYEVLGHLEQVDREREACRVLAGDETFRNTFCILDWSKRAMDHNNYPGVVFDLLGIGM